MTGILVFDPAGALSSSPDGHVIVDHGSVETRLDRILMASHVIHIALANEAFDERRHVADNVTKCT